MIISGSPLKERRNHKRIRVNLPVIYIYFGEHNVTAYKGTTYDISDSGVCFYTDIPLQKGLTLDIQIPHILDIPKTCVVKWNSMKSTRFFKVGVSFL